ncbi:hypothetical protein PO124_08560 [Bacillus licheniformis]|nr:hypothetical protein [Bacillus licheniformis]
MLKRTPLFDLYKEYGGKRLIWRLGTASPISSIKEEHEAVRTKAGLLTSHTWERSKSQERTAFRSCKAVDKRCFDAERRRRPVYGYVL